MIVSVLINLILFSIIAYMSIDSKDKRKEIRMLNRRIEDYGNFLSSLQRSDKQLSEIYNTVYNYINSLNEFDKTKGLSQKQQGLLQAYTRVKEILDENA